MCMGSDTSFSCMYIHVRVIAQVCCRSTCTAHHEFKTSLAGHTREQTMKVVNPPWAITQQVCYSMQEPRHGVLRVFTEGGTTWTSTNEHLNNMYTCTYTCSVAEHGRYFCNKCASTCTVYLVDSPTDISWSILLTLSPNSPSCPSSLPSPPWQPGEKNTDCQAHQHLDKKWRPTGLQYSTCTSAGSHPREGTNHEQTTGYT